MKKYKKMESRPFFFHTSMKKIVLDHLESIFVLDNFIFSFQKNKGPVTKAKNIKPNSLFRHERY
jgi:hypothetical protein